MSKRQDLQIDQGATYSVVVEILDANNDLINTTGMTARGQIRKHYTSTNSVSFPTSLANGELTISLTANQTANMIAGRYVYDLELVNDGTITRILEGVITLTPEVTR